MFNNESRHEFSSSLRRAGGLDLSRHRHVRTLHNVEGIEQAVPIQVDAERIQSRILRERQAFHRQEAVVRTFHNRVADQRALLAAHKAENGAVVLARLEYMRERNERFLANRGEPAVPSRPK